VCRRTGHTMVGVRLLPLPQHLIHLSSQFAAPNRTSPSWAVTNIFLRKAHYLVLEGYDPRIHALYFCPQLYKYNSDKQLVALEGEEIGKLLAQSVKDGVIEKLPWCEPSNNSPPEPVISPTTKTDFDTTVVGEPSP
jgi:hypothetical protein